MATKLNVPITIDTEVLVENRHGYEDPHTLSITITHEGVIMGLVDKEGDGMDVFLTFAELINTFLR